MTKQQQAEPCAILFVGQDLEWIHAYLKFVKQIFRVKESIADADWKLEAMLKDATPNVVVITATGQNPPSVQFVRQALSAGKMNVPILLVAQDQVRLDEWTKQGCDFVVPRPDVHTAIKYTQKVMQYEQVTQRIEKNSDNYQSIKVLYDILYQDLPDPVCYVQDGLFMDANPAFLAAFGLKSVDALLDLTLMNLVSSRSEKELKAQLRTVMTKGIAPAEELAMQTVSGERRDFICRASKVKYRDTPAIQLHFRDPNVGGSVGSASDKTTGLPNFPILMQSLEAHKQTTDGALGYWVLLWVENYREVWQKDGLAKGEILMKAVAEGIEHYLPATAMATRYNDDIFIVWLQEDYETVHSRLDHFLKQMTEEVPDGIGRLIHPSIYAAIEAIPQDYQSDDLLSATFKGCKALSLAQSGERIAESGMGVVSRKDERRVAILRTILNEHRLHVRYQPISALDPDGVARFAAQLSLELVEEDGDIELDNLLQIAERYHYARTLDEMKITQFLQEILSSNRRENVVNMYLPLSTQSLSDDDFASWVINQFKQTGISPKNAVFEISLDTANNAFSGTQQFTKSIREVGGKIALSEVSRLDDEVMELFSRIKPEIIKLDMREIDTFEDEEEDRFMSAIKSYEGEHGTMIIVDHMESPAQLSRVWPHDLKYLQGDGLLPAMDNLVFDFSEPLF